jgi:hypothetical protein
MRGPIPSNDILNPLLPCTCDGCNLSDAPFFAMEYPDDLIKAALFEREFHLQF